MSYLKKQYDSKIGNTKYPNKLIKYLTRGIRCGVVIDIGPGLGYHMDAFKSCGFYPIGVDIEESLERDERHDVHIIEDMDSYWTGCHGNSAQIVFIKSVIEHIDDPSTMLAEAHRVLRDDGKLIVMTPSWKHVHEVFYDDYTHVKPYTLKSLNDTLEVNDFSVEYCSYFTQLPFYWNNRYLAPIIWLLARLRFIKSKLTKFAWEKMMIVLKII